MPTLTLAAAEALIDAGLKAAAHRGAQPLCMAVLDAGGHLVAAKRMDGASFFRARIATAKAVGALGMGMGTREIAGRAKDSPAFYQALSVLTDGGLAPSPGGILLYAGGELVGAIGASGDKPDVDEACALAGVAEAGFEPGC